MPGKYHCTATRPPAGEIGNYIDSAVDDADAIRQFREIQRLDRWEAANPEKSPIHVEAKLIEEIPGSPNQMATEAGLDKLPVSATEAVQQAVEDLESASQPEIEPEPEKPAVVHNDVDSLREFGLDDRQVYGLRQANLLTTEAIVNFAKGGGKFDELPGLLATDELAIKQAVKAAQHGRY